MGAEGASLLSVNLENREQVNNGIILFYLTKSMDTLPVESKKLSTLILWFYKFIEPVSDLDKNLLLRLRKGNYSKLLNFKTSVILTSMKRKAIIC